MACRAENNRACRAVLLFVVCLFAGLPVWAWKPITHVYLANQALKDAVNDGKVTIYAVDYARNRVQGDMGTSRNLRIIGTYDVDPDILRALRAYPEKFWAGCLGPDAYPDIATGQTVIHPPSYNGPDGNADGPDGGTGAWIRHLWECAHLYGGNRDANLAFTLGFMAHGAGDVFAHTFINHYTGGIFNLDPPQTDNAVRHIVLEGYILERTPSFIADSVAIADDGRMVPVSLQDKEKNIFSLVASSGIGDGVDTFLRDSMVNASENPALYDVLKGANTNKSIPYLYSRLRDRLKSWQLAYSHAVSDFDNRRNAKIASAHDWSAKADACSITDFSCSAAWDRLQEGADLAEADGIEAAKVAFVALLAPAKAYVAHWMTDISTGLGQWPHVSHDVAMAMMFNPDYKGNLDDAKRRLITFTPTIGSMSGLPDPAMSVLQSVLDPLLDLQDAIAEVKENISDAAFVWAFGRTSDEIKALFTAPHVTLDTVYVTGPTPHLTLSRLNPTMGLTDTGWNDVNEKFDHLRFPPAYNTVVLIKLMLMKPEEVNRLLSDLQAASNLRLSTNRAPYPDNIMLDWVTSFDGSLQYVPNPKQVGGQVDGPGMLFARDARLFKTIFMKTVPEQTPDPVDTAPASTVVAPTLVPTLTYAQRGDVVTFAASEACDWGLGPDAGHVNGWTQFDLNVPNPPTAVPVAGGGTVPVPPGAPSGRFTRLTMDNVVPVGGTLTVTCTSRATGKTATATIVILPDLQITPGNVDVYSGDRLRFTTNADNPTGAPSAPAPGRIVQTPNGPITVPQAMAPAGVPRPTITWRVLQSGQDVPGLIDAAGNFTAPTVSAPAYFAVQAIRTDPPGMVPTTSEMEYQRVRVLPRPAPISVSAAKALLGPGETSRLVVTPNVPVTWSIVGNANGCRWQSDDTTNADLTTAKQTRDEIQTHVSELSQNVKQSLVAREYVAGNNPIRQSLPPRTDSTPNLPPTAAGGRVRTLAPPLPLRLTGSAITAPSASSSLPGATVAVATPRINPARLPAGTALPAPPVVPEAATPALETARQNRDAYLASSRDRYADVMARLEAARSTLVAPGTIPTGAAVRIRATAIDGTNRIAEMTVNLRPAPATANVPVNTPPSQPATPVIVVGGTPQQPSQMGRFGTYYLTGLQSAAPFAVAVERAEYSAGRFAYGSQTTDGNIIAPKADEKLLIFTARVKNVGTHERDLGYRSLGAYVIMPDNTRTETTLSPYRADNHEAAAVTLQPGGELSVRYVLVLPARGPARTLVVFNDEADATHYDLRANSVAPLPREVADPADGENATFAPEVTAHKNVAYPTGKFDITLLGTTKTDDAFADNKPGDGKTFLVISLRARNRSQVEETFGYNRLVLEAYDTDDDKYEALTPYKEAKNEPVTSPFSPERGASSERIVRYYIEVPRNARLKRLTIREAEGHLFVFDAAQLQ